MHDYIRQHKSKEEKKEKERLRHRDIKIDDIDYIPASEQTISIFHDNSPKRVGAYIRVSTDDENQTSSFEMQRKVYEDLVNRYPNWTLVNIYADA